jgi:hypothetical protein
MTQMRRLAEAVASFRTHVHYPSLIHCVNKSRTLRNALACRSKLGLARRRRFAAVGSCPVL